MFYLCNCHNAWTSITFIQKQVGIQMEFRRKSDRINKQFQIRFKTNEISENRVIIYTATYPYFHYIRVNAYVYSGSTLFTIHPAVFDTSTDSHKNLFKF